MCSQLFPDARRRIRKIHDHDQQQAGAARYADAGQLYRYQAEESRRLGNPARAAHLDDMAADCDVVADDILDGRRRP